MPSHRVEVVCGWRIGYLVPLAWNLVHCSRWLRLEEAGAMSPHAVAPATCPSLGLLSLMSSSVSSTFVAITTSTFQRLPGL